MFDPQMMNKEFGGSVQKKSVREDGQFTISVNTDVTLFRYVSRCKWNMYMYESNLNKLFI